ncbi:prolyl 4-hydroxylase subunit alpha-1-like [Eupeodes corollae]|uniref:prolyl 4-hydroxylase subunit alpha-1-like n=1 Tax=Eupeodes corollae TaxID=290404 RepID=UPI002491B936|nr:prolyl 4-hydroxylase subunit alpha-1-like [Eupeodes corollae]
MKRKTDMKLLTVLLFLINLLDCVQPEALSLSIAGLESLVAREKFLIDNLELYLGALERKAHVIRSNLDRMRAENNKAALEGEAYLMNPLQAFPLLRRLHSDWLHWQLYLQKSTGDEYVKEITNERQHLPSEEEFNEAADAMFRLQDTYELDPTEMSIGILNGVQYDVSLSAIDCFSIGYRLLHDGRGRYVEASMWFQSALNLFNEGNSMNEVLDFKLAKILYSYSQSLAKQDKLSEAMPFIDYVVQVEPGNAIALQQREIWKMEMKAKENFPPTLPKEKYVDPARQRYRLGCQGKYRERVANLHCVYNTTTDPFLKLAPLKMEQISLDPYVVLYHDVLSDLEIEVLQTMATPNLQRATVYSETEMRSVSVPTRTSKFAWFPDNTNYITSRISRRLEDMTGFGMETSEHLQAMNYGIGGHYDTHHDFFNVSRTSSVVQYAGDRIATAMFYLSDVKQGGATVFPNVQLGVFPKKGACIFWHNLNTRGEGDPNTLHAACPVIVGSKWVCNKWIREKEQMFRRPCPREM